MLQREVNIRTHGNVERALLVGLVRRRHNDVPIWSTIQLELLGVKAPRDELQSIFVEYVVFSGLNVSRVDVETDHGTNEGHADLFLPGLLGPAKSDFNSCGGLGLQLEKELGVLHPSA